MVILIRKWRGGFLPAHKGRGFRRQFSMKVKLYCKCGAYWVGSGLPPMVAEAIEKIWDGIHGIHPDNGGSCAPCTPEEARRARSKAEAYVDIEDGG